MRCVAGRYEHRKHHADAVHAAMLDYAREFHPRIHPEFADKSVWLRAIETCIRELKRSIKADQRRSTCVLVATAQLRRLRFAAYVLNANRKNGWTNSYHRHLPEDIQIHDGMLFGHGLPHYCPVELRDAGPSRDPRPC